VVQPPRINRDWADAPCVVAASGPSLTKEVAWKVRKARWFDGWHVIAVNDAFKLLSYADILYGADIGWWRLQDLSKFHGARWSCHSRSTGFCDDKSEVYRALSLRLVEAREGRGFSADPQFIHYGVQSNSGFHAVNLALLIGAPRVVLVGFDMRRVDGKSHFFGDHPAAIRRQTEDYNGFVQAFPADSRIVNATPESALKVYAQVELDDALEWDGYVHRDGSVASA